ncbi:hypothetical protein PCANC_28464 [Puccinia coronata f. sp. avenae]|uniref:SH3 domain-containing protein n=1 Tax=Puccinia coronata f. sp. avenae TaxID=200324 RepID=A0A2N5VGS8_9BASI|nr:hypothetical protein PCANC_28464 [Puccinia coronata f. sp. avenae]PLW49106.1 hypothetical protein PCASD_03053 [Puccinia coronata f. sp. avenae]
MLSPAILLLVISYCSLGYALPALAVHDAAGLTHRIARAPGPSRDVNELVKFSPGRVFRWDPKARALLPNDLPQAPPPMKAPSLQATRRNPTPEEQDLINYIISEAPQGFDYEIQPGEHMEVRRLPKGNWDWGVLFGGWNSYSPTMLLVGDSDRLYPPLGSKT